MATYLNGSLQGSGGTGSGLNAQQVRGLIADWAETGQPIPAGTTFQTVNNATELAAINSDAVIFARVGTTFNGNLTGSILIYVNSNWTSVLISQVINAETDFPAIADNGAVNIVAVDLRGNIYSLVKQFRGSVAAVGTVNEYAPTNSRGAHDSPPSPAHLDQFYYNISDGQWYIGEGHFGGIFWFAVSFNRVTGDSEDIWLGQHDTLQDFYNHVDPNTYEADKIFGYIRNPEQNNPNLIQLTSFTAGTDAVTSYSWKRSGADNTARIAILENRGLLTETEIQALIDASDGDKVDTDDAETTTITGTGTIDDPKKIGVTYPYSERDADLLHDLGARPDWHPQAHDLQRTGTQYDYEFWYQGETRWINKALHFENQVYVLNDSGLIGENPETENLDLGESPLHTFTRNAGNIYAIHRSNRDFYAFRASDGQRFGIVAYTQEIIDIDIEEDEPTEMFTIEKTNNNSIRIWNYSVSNTPEGNVPGASSFIFDHEFFDLTRSAVNGILSANGLSELSIISHNFATGETRTYGGVVSISKRNDHLYIGITGLSEVNGRAGTAIIRVSIAGSKNSISYALDTDYCIKLNIPDQVNKIIATADGFIVSLEQAIDEYHRGGFGFLDLVDTPTVYEMMQQGYLLTLNDTGDGITFVSRTDAMGGPPGIDEILVPDSARGMNIPDDALNLLLAIQALNQLVITMTGSGLTETEVNTLIATALVNYSTTADITASITAAIANFLTETEIQALIAESEGKPVYERTVTRRYVTGTPNSSFQFTLTQINDANYVLGINRHTGTNALPDRFIHALPPDLQIQLEDESEGVLWRGNFLELQSETDTGAELLINFYEMTGTFTHNEEVKISFGFGPAHYQTAADTDLNTDNFDGNLDDTIETDQDLAEFIDELRLTARGPEIARTNVLPTSPGTGQIEAVRWTLADDVPDGFTVGVGDLIHVLYLPEDTPGNHVDGLWIEGYVGNIRTSVACFNFGLSGLDDESNMEESVFALLTFTTIAERINVEYGWGETLGEVIVLDGDNDDIPANSTVRVYLKGVFLE